MKKLTAVLLAMGMVLLGLVFATPAQAGESSNIPICHATSSDKNPYTAIIVSKTAIVKGKGHGQHSGDIIPPFTYSEKKDGPLLTYPGLNWPAGEATLSGGCKVAVEPLPPVYDPGTCLNPTGTMTPTVPQPKGVVLVGKGAVLNEEHSEWRVTYAPAEGHRFATGEPEKVFTAQVIPPGPSDPNWDAEAGECKLPNMGAGTVATLSVLGGAVLLLGLGAILASRKRREEA